MMSSSFWTVAAATGASTHTPFWLTWRLAATRNASARRSWSRIDTVSLTLDQWAICFAASLAMLIVAEGRKFLGIHTVEPARQNTVAPVPVPAS